MEGLLEKNEEQNQAALARAFKAFQESARTRDEDPESFEAARTRYYFLKNGPEWLEQEKKRISSQKLDPVLDEYRDMYSSLESEENVQKAYTDSVAVIRDQQEALTANTDKRASYFSNLIEREKQKKSAFDRYVELTSPTSAAAVPEAQEVSYIVKYFSGFPGSFTTILDIAVGLLVVFLLLLIFRKSKLAFMSFGTSSVAPGIVIQSPALGPTSRYAASFR
jgi:hypothetical protein